MASPKMDMELLKREPESAFKSPMEIVSHEGLNKDQKEEVLAAWEDLLKAGEARPDLQAGDRERLLRLISEARGKFGVIPS